MDCNTARLLIELQLSAPHDLADTEQSALNAHLAECVCCAELTRSEQEFDRFLRARRHGVPVPSGLRDRVLVSLARDQTAAFWRQTYRVASAVAAVLLFAAAGVWLSWPRPAHFDSTSLARSFGAGQGVVDRASAVEFFRNEYRVETAAPSDAEFDYRLLTACDMTKLQGQSVPQLRFQRNETQRAVVYVVRRGQFEPNTLEPGELLVGSPCSVQVLPTDDPNFVLVVAYTGRDLRDFRPPHGGGVA